MPEIKHNFTGGKMNKDVDERLVPKGEYRDAMNIQVSTSDESDVGTIQNILGNSQGCANVNIPSSARTIGSISDEKNDSLYWLISGQEFDNVYSVANTTFTWAGGTTFSDMIMQKTTTGCQPVFVDNYGFVEATQENTSVDSLTLPYWVMQKLEVGMTVTGVSNNSSPSNTVTLETVTKFPNADFTIGYTPGNILGQAPLLSGVYVGLFETSFYGSGTVTFAQTNDVFVTVQAWNTLNLSIANAIPDVNTGYPGAEFEIPGLTQPNTHITSATAVSLTYTNGTGQNMIKITLDQPLNSPTTGQPPWTAAAMTIGMTGGGTNNALATYYPTINNGNAFYAAVSWSTYSLYATLNGNITFTPSYLSFLQGLNVGDEILPNALQFPDDGTQYFVGSIDIGNYSITVVDGNGNIVLPNPNWGNHGTISVITTNSGTVTFNNTLNLTSDTEFLFFSRDRVLNFNHNNLITGINIVDDMLFWTDGITEPKKINIKKSIEGTVDLFTHTLLVNSEQNIDVNTGVDVKEKHITVIRRSPKSPLTVNTETSDSFTFGTTLDSLNFLVNPSNAVQGNLVQNSSFEILLVVDPLSPNVLNNNDIVLLNPIISNDLPNDDHQVQLILKNQVNDGSQNTVVNGVTINAGTYQIWNTEIVQISYLTSTDSQEYNWAVKAADKQKFKNKFPRYSYRYKYIDGEYSSFAPFTNIIFQPRDFKYHVTEAYNIGMENQITKTTLTDYNINIPKDVIEIDLLYKESNSPVIYTIDTIRKNDLTLLNSAYEVKPSQIKGTVPENQLLRPWDNVPRSALAQEVTGNRIVYGNYLQNYTVPSDSSFLNVTLVNRSTCDVNSSYKSLKSIRNYSLGVSYLDKYGRQSPVFANKQGEIEIPISKSKFKNQISTNIIGDIPDWATHYKIFVKETSNEYYNLAMDRLYNAEDDNVWLSFPSSDRNKVDEETFLILKKGVEGATPVVERNKYKIIAIENEAPDFVKTKITKIGAVAEPGTVGTYFPNSSAYPIKDQSKVIIHKQNWDTEGLPLNDIPKIQVRFTTKIGTLTQQTGAYDVINFQVNDSGDRYILILDRPIEEEWTTPDGSNPTTTAGVIIFEKEIISSPEFDGRFFVKVSRDININNYIVQQATDSLITTYQVVTQLPFYYIADSSNPYGNPGTTSALTTGQSSPNDTIGNESNTWYDWNAIYGANAMGTSGWFIDSAYYAGTYPNANFLQENGMLPPTEGTGYYDGTITYNVHTDYPETATPGYNKGIWQDPNTNKIYMYLTFGQIQSSKPNASSWQDDSHYLHTSANDGDDQTTVATDECFDGFINAGPSSPGSFQNGCLSDDGLNAFHEGLFDWENNNDHIKHWRLGSQTTNPAHADEKNRINKLQQGQKFKFAGDDTGELYTILETPEIKYHLSHSDTSFINDGYSAARADWISSGNSQEHATGVLFDYMAEFGHSRNRRITYILQLDKDPRLSANYNPIASANANTLGTIQFVEELFVNIDDQIVSEDPAVWETEPKEDVGLDIYYEIDDAFPLKINDETNYSFAPVGSTVSADTSGIIPSGTTVVNWSGNMAQLSQSANESNVLGGETVTFSRPNGSCVKAKWLGLGGTIFDNGNGNESFHILLDPDVSNQSVSLAWFNCYSFLNGVESDRIRDDFNQVRIDKGAKASSTIDEPYQEEHRLHGLIYSGLYNSNSGINDLNQFIMAEKITKDINPIYGSIQKLHTRDADLITLCEDKILKILANKDAVFNADGNANLTATNRVLGQTVPFVGEYGISKNPESFASESYRAYFTDKVRGAVMRLSRDGLTAISNHGMKNWFKDNLKLGNPIIGSYDDKKDEYNLTIQSDSPKTVTFKEDVKGWVSFKSFFPENAISCANEYYTFKQGSLWKHHDSLVDRNTFYSLGQTNDEGFTNSSFIVVLNEIPGSVKSFKTINYEGSQAKVTQSLDKFNDIVQDGQYFNLENVKGWTVSSFLTNLERGSVTDFIEKEGKWFGHVVGSDLAINDSGIVTNARNAFSNNFDTSDFSVGGIGMLKTLTITSILGCTQQYSTDGVTLNFNYNPDATIDDGSCIAAVYGCTDPNSLVYNPNANTDNGSCLYVGCTDPSAFNYDPNANSPCDASGTSVGNDECCIARVVGCTIPGNFNYDSTANTPCSGSYPVINSNFPVAPGAPDNYCCEPFIFGCEDQTAYNYNAAANSPDPNNPCIYVGCTDDQALNFDFYVNAPSHIACDDVNCYKFQTGYNCCCEYPPNYGCIDPTAENYEGPGSGASPEADTDDGSCEYRGCTDPNIPSSVGYYPAEPPACNPTVVDWLGDSYPAVHDDGSCIYCSPPSVVTSPMVDFANLSVEIYWKEMSQGLAPHTSKFQLEWKEVVQGSTWENSVIVDGSNASIVGGGYNSDWAYVITGLGTAGTTFRWRIKQIDCDNGCSSQRIVATGYNWTNPYYGCTDGGTFTNTFDGGTYNNVTNYDPGATFNDGSCLPTIPGCPSSNNNAINSDCNSETNSLSTTPCTDGVTVDDGSCVAVIAGCTDPGYFNTDTTVNTDCNGTPGGTDTSCCEDFVYGCLDNQQAINGSNITYGATNYLGAGNDLGLPVANTNCDNVMMGCDNDNTDCDGPGSGVNENGCCTWLCPQVFMNTDSNQIDFSFDNVDTVYPKGAPGGVPQHVVVEITYYDWDVSSSTLTQFHKYGDLSTNTTADGFVSPIMNNGEVTGKSRTIQMADVPDLLGNNRSYVQAEIKLHASSSTSTSAPTTGDGGNGCDVSTQALFQLGCMDSLADNYNSQADVADNSLCVYTGCLDATQAVNSPAGTYAASNYAANLVAAAAASGGTLTACDDGTGSNSCCTYFNEYLPDPSYYNEALKVTDSGPAYQLPNGIFVQNSDEIKIKIERTGTGYAYWYIWDITFGAAQTGTDASGNPIYGENYTQYASNGPIYGSTATILQGINSGQVSLIAISGSATFNPVTGTTVPTNWVDYVDNGTVTIKLNETVHWGTIDNGSTTVTDRLNFRYLNGFRKIDGNTQVAGDPNGLSEVTYTAGCKNPVELYDDSSILLSTSDYANLDTTLDLHVPYSCIKAEQGCMDPTTRTKNPGNPNFDEHYFDVLHNTDCDGVYQPNSNTKIELKEGNATTGINWNTRIVTLEAGNTNVGYGITVGQKFVNESGVTNMGAGANAFTGYAGAQTPNHAIVTAVGDGLTVYSTYAPYPLLSDSQFEVSEYIYGPAGQLSDAWVIPYPTPTYNTGCCCYGTDFIPTAAVGSNNTGSSGQNNPGGASFGVYMDGSGSFAMNTWTDTTPTNGVYGNSRVRLAIEIPTTELMGTPASSAKIRYAVGTSTTYYAFNGTQSGGRVLAYTHPDFPGYLMFDCAGPQYPSSHFSQEGGFLEETDYTFKVELYVDNCLTKANPLIISATVPNYTP